MLLDIAAFSIPDYRFAGGYQAPAAGAADLLDAVSAAGLRGRGGAWFPVERKWRAALAEVGPRVLVANGAEDEPGSLKDRHLMATAPHLVLDGAMLAARALGADTVRLYVNEHADAARNALERALAEAADFTAGIDVAVVGAPAIYVAGEDSAAVEFLETGTARPRDKPPYPASAGLHGRPTVVNNVETLAHVAWIARAGAAAFRAHGTSAAPGTMLVTIPDECANPGVYEVEIGAYLDEVLAGVGGGFVAGPARGVQVGGPASGWLRELHVTLDPEAVSAAGSTLGCGAVRVLPAGHCAVDAVVSTSEFFAREQCGKCPPCRMATQFIHRATAALAENKGTTAAQLDTAPALVGQVRDKTACSLVSFPLAPLTTGREVFATDFAAHLAGQDCGLIHRRRSLRIEGT